VASWDCSRIGAGATAATPSRTADSAAVHASPHTEDSRPFDGACIIWANDLTTQKWAVYRLALRLPRRFPLDPVTIDPGTELDPL